MKKYIITIITFVFIAYGISKRTDNFIEKGLRSILFSQLTMTTFLVEFSNSIFEKDSISKGNSIFIQSLKATFNTRDDTFKLQIDSVKASLISKDSISFRKIILIGDSLGFQDVVIPTLKNKFIPDTLNAYVKCEYKKNDSQDMNNEKCIQGYYIIIENKIELQDSYKSCTELSNDK